MSRPFLTLALGAGCIASPALAQRGASISGQVLDKTSKAGIHAADVQLAPGSRRLMTDSAGYFRFDQVTPGNITLLVRRIGFKAESAFFAVGANEDFDVLVELEATPQALDTVTVAGREDVPRRGKLAGFYERQTLRIGRFIEAKDLERMLHRPMADILASRIPGVRKIQLPGQSGTFIATSRMVPGALRSRSPPPCFTDVYLDGTIVYGGGVSTPPFDINGISPAHIAAIEFYSGASQIPVQYNKTGSACGVMLIWTK